MTSSKEIRPNLKPAPQYEAAKCSLKAELQLILVRMEVVGETATKP